MTCTKQHDEQHRHRLTDTGRQTEIKTAAFSQPALHIEQTDLEQIIRLAIFFNDALTVHQSKATSFVLPQFLLVGSVTHTDGF